MTFQFCRPGFSCPVCGKNADCRVADNGIIFCIRVRHQQDTLPGFCYLGEDKNGIFGMFKEQENTCPPAAALQPVPQAPALRIEEREVQYKILHAQLTLSPIHQEWLAHRGFPPEAVSHYGFCSYGPTTRLNGLTADLPGVFPKLPQLLRPRAGGLLIPMRSAQGQIRGYQLVPQARIDTELAGGVYPAENGKYLWLSSEKQGGAKLRLPPPIDALPVGYFEAPVQCPDAPLCLVEGGLKAALAAWLGGLRVLASPASGRFDAFQLQETINQTNPSKIILYPDAGMLENLSISQAYLHNYRVCQELSFELWVGWWDQFEKSDPDIDDLLLGNKATHIRLLSFDEYFLLHDPAIQRRLDPAKAKSSLYKVPRRMPRSLPLPTSLPELQQSIYTTLEEILRHDAC